MLNASPESAVRESVATDRQAIADRAAELCREGAHWIDLGGRSISAGVDEVSDQEEQSRVCAALAALRESVGDGVTVSVDTWSPATARVALEAGANAVNYTGGLLPPELLDAAAQHSAPMVITFMPYENAYAMRAAEPAQYSMEQIVDHLGQRAETAKRAGVEQVIVDPNLGIFHAAVDDYEKIHCQLGILHRLDELRALGHPILIYSARKPERLARIMVASQTIFARPDYIRIHQPSLITRLLRCEQASATS